MTRYIAEESSTYPYAAMAYVEAIFPDGSIVYGSGALVGPNDILTAAHLVFDPARGGQASGVTVIPGRDGSRYPFDTFKGASLDYHALELEKPNFILQSESQQDLALIGLEYAIGDNLGWFEFAAFSEETDYNVTGYPGEYYGAKGPRLMESSGTTIAHHYYDLIMLEDYEISQGSSGSPVWVENDGTLELVGVVSTQRWAALVEANQDKLQAWIDGNDVLIKASMPEFDKTDTRDEMPEKSISSQPLRPEAEPEPEPERSPEADTRSVPEPASDANSAPRSEPEPKPVKDSKQQEPKQQPAPEVEPSVVETFVARFEAKGWDWPDALVRELEMTDTLLDFPGLKDSVDPVIRLYTGMLDRPADKQGLEYWVKKLNSGSRLDELAKDFVSSAEFTSVVEQYGGGDSGFIDALYHNVLDRTPDSQGRVYWLNSLLSDGDADDKSQIVLSFTNSEEYVQASYPLVQGTKLLTWGVNLERMNSDALGFNSGGSSLEKKLAESVVRLYLGVLDREPDQEGLEYWLEAGDQEGGLETLANTFLNSDEFLGDEQQLSVDKVLDTLYRQVLKRAPDASGERYWQDRFEQEEMALGDLVLAFTESPEFQRKSQSAVDDYLQDNLQVGLTGVETDLSSYLLG
ncbi:DUF4214 domain-containing protein [Vreelandella aquamarina]